MRRTRLCLLAALSLIACKRSAPTPASLDAGGPTARPSGSAIAPPPVALWDGLFGAARTPSGAVIVAVASTKSPWLRLLELDATGVESRSPVLLAVAEPVASAPSVAPFADGSLAVIYSGRLGDPPSARMLSVTREPIGERAVVGAEWCGTEDSLYFLDRDAHRLRRWAKGEASARPAEGPSFAAHATPLCGARAAFVLEPKGGAFDVVLANGFARTRVAAGVDPTSGGTTAVYMAGDSLGVVAALAQGTLSWTTVSSAGEAVVHPVAHKIHAEQTLIAADGTGDRVSVLLQRDGKKRCGEDETPPSYDLVELGAPGRSEVVALPLLGCDSESSSPDVQQTKSGVIVRWFEWKDEGAEKLLRFWSRPPSRNGGDGGAGMHAVPPDTVLLDCGDDRCLAVGRTGPTFRVVTTP